MKISLGRSPGLSVSSSTGQRSRPPAGGAGRAEREPRRATAGPTARLQSVMAGRFRIAHTGHSARSIASELGRTIPGGYPRQILLACTSRTGPPCGKVRRLRALMWIVFLLETPARTFSCQPCAASKNNVQTILCNQREPANGVRFILPSKLRLVSLVPNETRRGVQRAIGCLQSSVCGLPDAGVFGTPTPPPWSAFPRDALRQPRPRNWRI